MTYTVSSKLSRTPWFRYFGPSSNVAEHITGGCDQALHSYEMKCRGVWLNGLLGECLCAGRKNIKSMICHRLTL